MNYFVIIAIAILLDRLIGDPPNWPHPVRFYGWLIKRNERWVRKHFTNLVVGGYFLVFLSIAAAVLPIVILHLLLPPLFFNILAVYVLFTCLASKCLCDEAKKVAETLLQNDIEKARLQISYLVGRDTSQLDETGIVRATVETVAENTIDGVLAPLFMMLIGAPFGISVELAVAYKVVNTLDSMVGYIHDPYREIGFASAKLDDLFNLIPARLGALLMILAGGVSGSLRKNANTGKNETSVEDTYSVKRAYAINNDYSIKNAYRVFMRDRYNHKSPNSAHPESVVAGLLGIRLGGTNTYFGNVVVKPTIGDSIHEIEVQHIDETNRILYSTLWLVAAITILLAIFSTFHPLG
ncbi:MAG: cobalamin biosynthesis protein CobD [Clostridiales bacterium 38-18]|nr:MAG: cobalamin biosynthesis protein CobD [Clostridiales bacterium 38-18]